LSIGLFFLFGHVGQVFRAAAPFARVQMAREETGDLLGQECERSDLAGSFVITGV
jgi:hypothetical protein